MRSTGSGFLLRFSPFTVMDFSVFVVVMMADKSGSRRVPAEPTVILVSKEAKIHCGLRCIFWTTINYGPFGQKWDCSLLLVCCCGQPLIFDIELLRKATKEHDNELLDFDDDEVIGAEVPSNMRMLTGGSLADVGYSGHKDNILLDIPSLRKLCLVGD